MDGAQLTEPQCRVVEESTNARQHMTGGWDDEMDRARSELGLLAGELGFEVVEVDITGVAELERRYREWIPVIEVDGDRVSVYRVEPAALRHKLGLA